LFLFKKLHFLTLLVLNILTTQINFTLCLFLNCASLTFSTQLLKETGCIVACDQQNYNKLKIFSSYKKVVADSV